MSEAEKPVAVNQLSKQGTRTIVQDKEIQCYFRPETEEFVFISANEATLFENQWREMNFLMNELHQANTQYSSVLEKYALEAKADAYLAVANIKDVDAAELELEAKRKKLQEKLTDLSHKGLGYKDVVELIPIVGQKTKHNPRNRSPRLAYVSKGYFSKVEGERKLHAVSLSGGEKKSAGQSIYSKDKNGNVGIDTVKLTKQLSALKGPKIKLELKEALKWADADQILKDLSEDYVLFDWAESWNNSLQGQKALGATIDVSGAAQFMRFASNCGGQAEFDVDKLQLSTKGEYRRTLTVASGFGNLSLYIPDRTGWGLKMDLADKGVFDMGLFRLCLDNQASGFVGGSLQLEAQLQVITQGEEQVVVGKPGGRLPRFRERKMGKKFYQTMEAEDEGLQVSAEFFVGARAELALKGSLQWMKPTPPPGDPSAPIQPVKSSGEFTDFCTIGSSIAGLTGLGAGGKFYCTFLNGRFCFHIAASLCWGVGAKGGLVAEVSAANIVEFGAWLVYQLYRLGYGFFEVVSEAAFKAYSKYCVMQIDKMGQVFHQGYEMILKARDDVDRKFITFLNLFEDERRNGTDRSEKRNELAKNIIGSRRDLLLHTPEAKGTLLYLLTRHSISDHIDPDNRTASGDIYKDRKEAVICVLTSIQTVSEWNKVMCRITRDGSSLCQSNSEARVVEEQVEHLVRFLQEGYNRDQDLRDIYKRLKKEVAEGYALDMNDSIFYQLNSLPNAHFPQRCHFGPCDGQQRELV